MMNSTINNIKDFATVIRESVMDILGTGYDIDVQDVLKNNNTHLTALTIKTENVNIAPTIYLDRFYSRYIMDEVDIPSICNEIVTIYNENRLSTPFDINEITDLESCRSRICFKIVNAERNKELLSDVPHMLLFGDIAVIFYIFLSTNGVNGSATVTIHNGLFNEWDITTDELYTLGMANTQRLLRGEVKSMANTLLDMLGDRLDEADANEFYDMAVSEADLLPMYVCTNASKTNGAGTILYEGLLEDCSSRTNSDFYILFCSIHEVILVPVSDDMSPEYLRSIVHDVNSSEVAPDEYLSDHVYRYNRETNAITLS